MKNTMRRLISFAVFLFVIVLVAFWPTAQSSQGPVVPAAAAATPTQFLWDYDFTAPNSRACSATVTVSCVSGFTVQTTNQTGPTVIAGPIAIALPATINTTGPTVGIAAPFTPPAAMGQYQIQVAVNWKDGGGAAQSGPTASLTYLVIPVTPANVRVQ